MYMLKAMSTMHTLKKERAREVLDGYTHEIFQIGLLDEAIYYLWVLDIFLNTRLLFPSRLQLIGSIKNLETDNASPEARPLCGIPVDLCVKFLKEL